MASRESSLGAWADKIPKVDGWTGQKPAWEEEVVEDVPYTPDQATHELKRVGVLLLMGIGPLLLAGGMLLTELDVIMHGERTSGTIVDLRRAPRGHAPVAAYYVGGERYVVKGSTSTRTSSYDVGDPVTVLYSPEDPARAKIDDFVQLYLLPTIFGSIGLVFVLLALGSGAYILYKSDWRIEPATR